MPATAWSAEFDDWAAEALARRGRRRPPGLRAKAPGRHEAHPRTEHLAPLFVALGASSGTTETARSVIDGFWYGLSKRAFQFD